MEFTGFMGEYVAYLKEKAEARGEVKGKFGALKALMQRMHWSADEAMDVLDFDPEVREQLKKQLLQESMG